MSMSKMEKFTRQYCRKHGIRYRMKSIGLMTNQLYLFNPCIRHYQYVAYCVENLTENQIIKCIEDFLAQYGK